MKELSDLPLLKDLTCEQFDLLAPLFAPFFAPPNTVIFKHGDRATHLYLITKGTVALQYKPYDGPEMTLAHLHAGDVFGWSAVGGGETYTASVTSLTELKAIRILRSDLKNLCDQHHDIGCAFLEKLAEVVSPRWKNAKGQISDMLQKNINTKKASA